MSRDERYIALVKTRTRNDNDVFLFDRHDSETTHLTPHEGNVNFRPQSFSPDSNPFLRLSQYPNCTKVLSLTPNSRRKLNPHRVRRSCLPQILRLRN